MTNRTIIIAAALAAAVSASPALAGERAERVTHSDLDLASAAGQAELQHRLDTAARRVCRFDGEGRLASPTNENACFRATRKTVDVKVAALTSESQLGG